MIWREGERVLASIMKINLFLPTRQERVFLMNREEGEWETGGRLGLLPPVTLIEINILIHSLT